MADPIRVDKGPITAYAMAVIGGYTGTYGDIRTVLPRPSKFCNLCDTGS